MILYGGIIGVIKEGVRFEAGSIIRKYTVVRKFRTYFLSSQLPLHMTMFVSAATISNISVCTEDSAHLLCGDLLLKEAIQCGDQQYSHYWYLLPNFTIIYLLTAIIPLYYVQVGGVSYTVSGVYSAERKLSHISRIHRLYGDDNLLTKVSS